MNRREFIAAGSATVASTAATISGVAAVETQSVAHPFTLKFAPHLGLLKPDAGMFRHHAGKDPVEQIAFMADQGFTALEDNWMKARDEATQLRVGRELARRDMAMGVIVNTVKFMEPTFVLNDPSERERLMQEVRETAVVARRVGAKYVTTLSGTAHPSLPRGYQTSAMIENLKWAGEVAAEEGIVLVVEPINHKGWPGTFLTEINHGYLITRAVDMPSVRLLYDFWHQQIHGGDLIENLDRVWDQIGYFQIADNPGRTEPGRGEINYGPILQRISDRGFDGIVGMEFDASLPGQDGERAIISAMRTVNPTVEGE